MFGSDVISLSVSQFTDVTNGGIFYVKGLAQFVLNDTVYHHVVTVTIWLCMENVGVLMF